MTSGLTRVPRSSQDAVSSSGADRDETFLSAPELSFTPSTRVLWRSPTKVQLELGARRLVIDGMPARTVDRLAGRPGTDDDGTGPPGRPDTADDAIPGLLAALHRAGFLSRHPSGTAASPSAASNSATPSAPGEIDRTWTAARAQLAPDRAALGERFGERSEQVMAARHRRVVTVEGSGRLPAMIAALLAAGGIGHVHLDGAGDVTLWDVAPGGLIRSDEGHRRVSAGHEAVHRAAPHTDTRWVPHFDADLVVLAGSFAPAADAHGALHAAGIAHLSSAVWASSAVVGPLVIPTVSSCVSCAELHRGDRDPAWPALAAQLAAVRKAPSDVSVCAFAAALTALQAFAFLDGEQPATVDGTLEMSLPDWRIRRRTWRVHHLCPCQQ